MTFDLPNLQWDEMVNYATPRPACSPLFGIKLIAHRLNNVAMIVRHFGAQTSSAITPKKAPPDVSFGS
jgi:hypothetical protein